MESNVYQENGYENRSQYLNDLADSHGIDAFAVYSIAEMLGQEEDFDALPCALDEYACMLGGF